MDQLSVVLAELDEWYVLPLTAKLIEMLGTDVNLQVITSKTYFDDYFSEKKEIDLLIIDEELYSMLKHMDQMKETYILTEQMLQDVARNFLMHNLVYKHKTPDEIYETILQGAVLRSYFGIEKKIESKAIIVSSLVHGAGRTEVSSTLCKELVAQGNKVLYLCGDEVPCFGYDYIDKSCLPEEAASIFEVPQEGIYEKVKTYIRTEVFDYLPPFATKLSLLGITMEKLMAVLEVIKIQNEYDFIVVDLPVERFFAKSNVLELCDYLFLLVLQGAKDVYKAKCMVSLLPDEVIGGAEVICNQYRKDWPNYWEQDTKPLLSIKEYIEYAIEGKLDRKQIGNITDLLYKTENQPEVVETISL